MTSKIGAVLVGLLLVLGFGTSAASAYTVTAPGATVSSSTAAPGGSVTFGATGFRPGSPVTVTASLAGSTETRTSTVTASSTGTVSTAVVLGSAGQLDDRRQRRPRRRCRALRLRLRPGQRRLRRGAGPGAPAPRGAALARTGVDGLATTAWAGFGILVLGGVLVAVASGRGRRRDLQDA